MYRLKSAGGALYLTPNLGPLFTQMGIMDEYLAKSKRCSTIRLFNENREQDFALDFSLNEELYSPLSCFIFCLRVLCFRDT